MTSMWRAVKRAEDAARLSKPQAMSARAPTVRRDDALEVQGRDAARAPV
ncbi:hypothetical protein MFUL124B02_05835 [Myxococcus fulvus 124B02]|nr:hypothetical protein MFUL124B02_05835 [Myxococcus fulvus 124B02]